jgi:hypothetical protein
VQLLVNHYSWGWGVTCQDCGILEFFADCHLDLRIGGIVDGGSSFVHDNHARGLEQGTGQAHELSLSLREIPAVFSDFRIEIQKDILVYQGRVIGSNVFLVVGAD